MLILEDSGLVRVLHLLASGIPFCEDSISPERVLDTTRADTFIRDYLSVVFVTCFSAGLRHVTTLWTRFRGCYLEASRSVILRVFVSCRCNTTL